MFSMLSLFSQPLFAAYSQWSLGAAVSYSPVIYQDTPSNVVGIPMVGYEGEHVFFRGFSAGYRMLPAGSPQNIVFRLMYDPRTFKPDDSTNANMQLLDERKSTVLGGVSYQLITMVGMFEATAGSDIGSTHNGLYAEAAWRLPIRMRGWGLTPSIGYSYNSEKINNHLYGVSQAESTATGGAIKAFDADWDGQFFVGLSAYMFVTKNIRLTGSIRYLNLEGDIENSPIIEHTTSSTATIGASYVF
ncbi:MipA/OmpV family protein [Aliivibrio sp.]|uniref:MipA/OmpV family protein n=1 Tax=Aliivibrio sp. TaxID=1872443 RepID=UPI003D2F1257